MIRKWIVVFGELFARDITAPLVDSWCNLLEDIEPNLLMKACECAAKTCKFFPTPADVRSQIDHCNMRGMQLEAEDAWPCALDWVQRYFHPDIGVARGAPELPAATQHAIIAAGGMRWIAGCPESELQWAKKRFVEDFMRIHETRQSQNLLTRPEARRILANLDAGEPTRQLRTPSVDKLGASKPSREEVREALNRAINAPGPYAQLSDDEWERRKRVHKERASEWARAHSVSVDASSGKPEEKSFP